METKWKVFVALICITVGVGSVAAVRLAGEDNATQVQVTQNQVQLDQAAEKAAKAQLATKAFAQARARRTAQLNMINQAQCAALKKLYSTIRAVLLRSQKSLPQIVYYKDHPDELARAKALNAAAIHAFSDPPCPPDISVGAP